MILGQFSDAAVLATFGGAIVLFLGKVISDTRVERYDTISYSTEGVLFVAKYILLPLAVALFAIENGQRLEVWQLIATQFVIFILVAWATRARVIFKKFGLKKFVKMQTQQKIEEIKQSETTLGHAIRKNTENSSNASIFDKFYEPIFELILNSKTRFLFSSIIFFGLLSLPAGGETSVHLISYVLSFLGLTLLAIAYGLSNAYYPDAKIYLSGNEPITGKILKFGDFVEVLDGEKKIFIKSDKIIKVEQSLWKNKTVE